MNPGFKGKETRKKRNATTDKAIPHQAVMVPAKQNFPPLTPPVRR